MVALLALVGCSPVDDGGVVPPMSALDLLVRTSLDLRGVRPTTEELAEVEADPDVVEDLVDAFLHDERFPARVRALWGELYLTRTESPPVSVYSFPMELPEAEYIASIGDEPLRILSRIAEEDRPITELVTADWTMANGLTSQIWPVMPVAGDEWAPSRYTDGRPPAGILSTNGMWWRYTSTDSNANRKRANAVSRLLLCNDYLTRPIDFDRNVNLLDEEALNDALRNDPGCLNCHVSLDPLAAYFFGFWWYAGDIPAEISRYHPEREPRWRDVLGTPPAFYGEPGSTLEDLGHQIAGDPRFPLCLTEQATQLLLRRPLVVEDTERITQHREALLSDLTLRSLIRSVVASPEYRAGDTDDPLAVPKKMLTPKLLASSVEDLTGYRMSRDGWDLLDSEGVGYLTLAGGADGYFVTETATSPNPTLLLVQGRLADAASAWVVAEEPDRLFTEIDFHEAPGDPAMARQVQALHWRIFGNRVAEDGPEVTANLELWEALYAVDDDPRHAWAGVLSVLLRDPDFLFY